MSLLILSGPYYIMAVVMTMKIIQFGEGNFLRAFAEYYIQQINDSGREAIQVYICQPRTNTKVIHALQAQHCRYDIIERGLENGQPVNRRTPVTCVSEAIDTVTEYPKIMALFADEQLKAVLSNVTEAGLLLEEAAVPEDFPKLCYSAKLTYLLYLRYQRQLSPLVVIPTELRAPNGTILKANVLYYAEKWYHDDAFYHYINVCTFCNTLVDRIVTGHDSEDSDLCSVCCEPYYSLVIQAYEAEDAIRRLTGDHPHITFADSDKAFQRYCDRKLYLLNGVHTMITPAALLAGFDIVRDVVNDALFSRYIARGLTELKACVPLPQTEIDSFADAVKERFANPYIDHQLTAIVTNSISKFYFRDLQPLLLYYRQLHKLPTALTFALAALLVFYETDERVNDVAEYEAVFTENQGDISAYLNKKLLWDVDFAAVDGLEAAVKKYYKIIINEGVTTAMEKLLNEPTIA